MGGEELASNIFRAAANWTHFDVGRKVRQTIAELGGTMPEESPTPAESIQQIRAREWRRELGAERQDFFGHQDRDDEVES
jgi:DNA-damage-inducible protein D